MAYINDKELHFLEDSRSSPLHSPIPYEPLGGFYGSRMYQWVVDDFGEAVVGLWPVLDLSGVEYH